MLDGHPTKFAPDERFGYCNGGYVVLALIAERASGTPFHELVHAARVPTGGDARQGVPPLGRAARRVPRLGYLDGDGRVAQQCLPPAVRGTGDGGATRRRRTSRVSGARFRRPDRLARRVEAMVRPRSDVREVDALRAGLWLHASTDAVLLVGGDAGVSFYSVHDPQAGLTYTVLANRRTGPGRSCACSTATRRLEPLVPSRKPEPRGAAVSAFIITQIQTRDYRDLAADVRPDEQGLASRLAPCACSGKFDAPQPRLRHVRFGLRRRRVTAAAGGVRPARPSSTTNTAPMSSKR